MADEITTKKVENLSENTEPADADVFLFGSGGTNAIKKIKWSNIFAKLRNVLFANNLTTTQAGYGLDARQGKALKDEIDKINTKISGIASKRIYNKNSATATPGNVATLQFDSEWEGYTAIGIGAFFIGNRTMSLYNLAMHQIQLQNISSTNQTVNAGAAYMDIIYIPD